jgi:hypothetical protein
MIVLGIKASVEDRQEIRRRWMQGESAVYIETFVDVNANTIRKICEHLPQHKRTPLSNQKITELMKTWRRTSE